MNAPVSAMVQIEPIDGQPVPKTVEVESPWFAGGRWGARGLTGDGDSRRLEADLFKHMGWGKAEIEAYRASAPNMGWEHPGEE